MKPTGKFIALITLALILILVKALLPYAKQEDNYSIERYILICKMKLIKERSRKQ